MITKRDLYLIGALLLLVLNAGGALYFYNKGKRELLLKQTTDALAIKQGEAFRLRRTRDSLLVVVNSLHEESEKSKAAAAKSDSTYEDAKKDVTLRGDTAITKDSSQVLLPQVAKRLRTAEADLADQKKANADLERENISLRLAAFTVDSNLLKKEDDLVTLNQKIAALTKGSRVGYGVQLGVGYCIGKNGGTLCAAVTFGPQVKLW